MPADCDIGEIERPRWAKQGARGTRKTSAPDAAEAGAWAPLNSSPLKDTPDRISALCEETDTTVCGTDESSLSETAGGGLNRDFPHGVSYSELENLLRRTLYTCLDSLICRYIHRECY